MPKGHAVIDGSNLATEGRREPSLAQLDEAVRAIDAEYDFAQIIVIVDATFEHRVAKSEVKAARAAVDDGDIITPPAGVIGRGDAFILQVADRADAVVFSNDSFQEFHGTYDWLFDEGRLVGGKPIPGVGWIYVTRSPVRGPISRRATADSRRSTTKKAASRTAAPRAAAPKKPVGKAPASEPSTRRERKPRAAAAAGDEGSNDQKRWKRFKADYPVGATIAATVDRFSSHGAYGLVDGIVVYLPNRLLGNPAPTKARDVIELGATIDFVVHRYDSDRHGIDAGLIPAPGGAPAPAKKTTAKRAVKKTTKKAAAKKPAAKKTTKKAAAKKTTAKRAVKKTTKKAAAKKPAVKKTTAKKTTAKKTTAKKATRRR
jgi:Zc3h12a-like ribonuclease protein